MDSNDINPCVGCVYIFRSEKKADIQRIDNIGAFKLIQVKENSIYVFYESISTSNFILWRFMLIGTMRICYNMGKKIQTSSQYSTLPECVRDSNKRK